jgi:hypothetical protein
MFGPVRGPWPDESWRGWWGEDPPFGHDVFVLTHHPRADLAIAPILLGAGERLFGDAPAVAGYSVSGLTCSGGIAHAHHTVLGH